MKTPPYEIQTFPGMGRKIPFKVYPNGFQQPATPDEVAMAECLSEATAGIDELVKQLEVQRKAHEANLAEVVTQMEEMKQAHEAKLVEVVAQMGNERKTHEDKLAEVVAQMEEMKQAHEARKSRR